MTGSGGHQYAGKSRSVTDAAAYWIIRRTCHRARIRATRWRMMTPSSWIRLTSAAEPARLRSRRSEPRLRRSWSTSPVCGCASPSTAELTKRSCRLGRLRFGHRHRRIVLQEDIGARIGRDEIGQAQFGARHLVQVFPRRHAERQRQQIAGSAHVEGVFREAADVALDDHQILRGVARGLGIVGAIAHPDLVHADMRAAAGT